MSGIQETLALDTTSPTPEPAPRGGGEAISGYSGLHRGGIVAHSNQVRRNLEHNARNEEHQGERKRLAWEQYVAA